MTEYNPDALRHDARRLRRVARRSCPLWAFPLLIWAAIFDAQADKVESQ